MPEEEKRYPTRVELEDGTTIHGKPCTGRALEEITDVMAAANGVVHIPSAEGDGHQVHIVPTRNIVMITYTDEEA